MKSSQFHYPDLCCEQTDKEARLAVLNELIAELQRLNLGY